MSSVSNPKRTPLFRLITIASSGMGGFVLGLWGLRFGLGDGMAGMPAQAMIGAIAALLQPCRRRCGDVVLRRRR
ncbi:hypothetical protein ACVOMV_14570 [Mesorhizobium atlanticum]